MERDSTFKPICHYKLCLASEYMLDQYQPYVETFFALRSELAGRAGFGEYIMREAEISGQEIELFLEMDSAGLQQREAARQAERKAQQAGKPLRR